MYIQYVCVRVRVRAREMYKTRAQILNFMNRMRKNEEAMKNTRDATQIALSRTRSRTHTQSTSYDGLIGGYNHTTVLPLPLRRRAASCSYCTALS